MSDKKEEKKGVGILLNIAIGISLIVMLISFYKIGNYVYERYKAEMEFRQLEDMALQSLNNNIIDTSNLDDVELDEANLKNREQQKLNMKKLFEHYRGINEDITAFISIDEVDINLPVAWHEVDGFYLRRGLDKQYSIPGLIFIDTPNNPDLTDRNTIIYGHNMSNGVGFAPMFKELVRYGTDEFKNGGEFMILKEDKIITYQMFSSYYTNMYADYIHINFPDDDEWVARLNELKSRTRVNFNNFDREFDKNDRIVTLSTCDNVTTEGRFTIHAVVVDEQLLN